MGSRKNLPHIRLLSVLLTLSLEAAFISICYARLAVLGVHARSSTLHTRPGEMLAVISRHRRYSKNTSLSHHSHTLSHHSHTLPPHSRRANALGGLESVSNPIARSLRNGHIAKHVSAALLAQLAAFHAR